MWDMADARNQHKLRAGDRVGDVLRSLGEVRAVFVAAQHQSLHLDVSPIVDDRIKICHLLDQRANYRESRPVSAERPRIVDAHILFVFRLPPRDEITSYPLIRSLVG